MRLCFLALGAVFFAVGCGASDRAEDQGSSAESALESSSLATIHFHSDYRVTTRGTLKSGRKVRIEYDKDRMPTCRGDLNGGPGWTVTGNYRFAGGDVQTFTAAGHSPTGTLDPVIFLPAHTGDADLEIWFQNTSRWGCSAWDSNYGDNFRFSAKAPPEAPQWLGNVRYVATRRTCENGACDDERKELGESFLYEGWARQRAAITEVTFQVYKPGITDYENGNAWRELDVKLHSRWRASDSFKTTHVDIQRRVGNDIRYAWNVRPQDPFVAPGATNASQCPDADVRRVGHEIEAAVEFYFSVNGVELRPAPGKTWRGAYRAADTPWAVCLP